MAAIKGRPISRLWHLSPERRRLLPRAAVILTAASAAVALFPFRQAIRFGCVPLGEGRRLPTADFVWAVEAAARRLPWRTKCIEKGLAAQRLLRRTGVDAVLHYGARKDVLTGELAAHVWVSVDGHPVIGGEEAAGFAEVSTFQ